MVHVQALFTYIFCLFLFPLLFPANNDKVQWIINLIEK